MSQSIHSVGDGGKITRLDPGARQTRQAGGGPAPAPALDAAARSALRLSDTARQVEALVRALDAVPVVDRARVEALRTAIDGGHYRIDPARVAERFIAFEAQLRR
ncbi:MAG: hypothetical protein KatS3mg121_1480 [Gammaproteobacteria bacterium]|nr:MAG: hypothetical protein KatS3mg121_1480 [Gammaproteobacteria bacterium]